MFSPADIFQIARFSTRYDTRDVNGTFYECDISNRTLKAGFPSYTKHFTMANELLELFY